MLISRRDINDESNVTNNNIDNIWKTVKANRGNNVNTKDNNRRFNSIDVRSKYLPLSRKIK